MADSGARHLLKRVATAVVLIPIVLLLVLKAPVWVLAIVAAIVALLASSEFLTLSEAYEIRPFRQPTYVYVSFFFALLAIPGYNNPLLSTAIFGCGTAFLAALAPFLFWSIGMRRANLRD
ncbi:MAG TPA: phosphatidate cytidylyltransferase, partial [Terriglobales bacterium]